MECEIVKNRIGTDIPMVGDVWHHPNTNQIYMRINDEHGSKVKGFSSQLYFFSVNLRTGDIVHTSLDARNIRILKYKKPIEFEK